MRSRNASPPACCAPTASHVFFRHELARLAIESSLPAHRRTEPEPASPSRRSRPSGGDDADPARLAHHAEAAGDTDAVLRYAPVAGDRAAAVGAHREAADQFARALRAGDELTPEAARRSARAARVLVLHHRPEPRGDRCAPRGGRVLSGSSVTATPRAARSGSSRTTSGAPAGSTNRSEAGVHAVELLEPLGPSRELGGAYGNLAYLGRASCDHEATANWGARARSSAARSSATSS